MKFYMIKFVTKETLTFLQGMTYDLERILREMGKIEKEYSVEIYELNDMKEIPDVYNIMFSKDFEMSKYWDGKYIYLSDHYWNYLTKFIDENKPQVKHHKFKLYSIREHRVIEFASGDGKFVVFIDEYINLLEEDVDMNKPAKIFEELNINFQNEVIEIETSIENEREENNENGQGKECNGCYCENCSCFNSCGNQIKYNSLI